MLTKKLCKDSARSVQDKTKVCFCFYCRGVAYLSLLMFSLKKELGIAKVICKPPVLVPKTAQKSSLSKIEETTRM